MPVSKILAENARQFLKDSMIVGFDGSWTATDVQLVDRYVLGISSDCQ